MIGLVIIAHGRLAEEFAAALQHVVGEQDGLRAIGIFPSDDVEQRRKEILQAVKEVDGGSGVLIVTDLFGGTPSNLAMAMMSKGKVEVIAGVNLPLLVRFARVRNLALPEAVHSAFEGGQKYIVVASAALDAP